MNKDEEMEALVSLLQHYGLPIFMKEIDVIIERVKGNILSVPLDKDPEKAALTLLQERMKVEGAIAVKQALIAKIKDVKEKQ